MSHLDITTESLTDKLSTAKLVITGMLVDLTLHNGWKKEDQFVAIPSDVADYITRGLNNGLYRGINERLELKFLDATNKPVTLSCNLAAKISSARYGILQLPDEFEISNLSLSDCELTASHPRLVMHVALGTIIMADPEHIEGNLVRAGDLNKLRFDTGHHYADGYKFIR